MTFTDYQAAASKWLRDCFGLSAILDIDQRGDRLAEEFIELLQASGYPKASVLEMVSHVYSRPAGVVSQEVGGAMVTLALFADVAGVNLEAAAVEELTRIQQPEVMAALREKQGERFGRERGVNPCFCCGGKRGHHIQYGPCVDDPPTWVPCYRCAPEKCTLCGGPNPNHAPAGRSDLGLEVELRRELAAERDGLRADVERLQVFAANYRDALSLLLHQTEAMISGRPARSMGKAIIAARIALLAEVSSS